jgi:hypothetical protein
MRLIELFADDDITVLETAPPGKKAKTWIKHRTADFKERYGKNWKSVLYAAAWNRFGHKGK